MSEHARNIIYKWQGLSSEEDGFLFPILKRGMSAEKERTTIKQAVKQVNKYIQKIAEKSGIDKPVTTYWARHSFSTILKRSGVSIEFISEALGHQSVSTTKSYLDSFEDETKKKMALLLTNF